MRPPSITRVSGAVRNPFAFLIAAFLVGMFWLAFVTVWLVVMACVLLYRLGVYLVERSGPSPFRSKDDILGREDDDA